MRPRPPSPVQNGRTERAGTLGRGRPEVPLVGAHGRELEREPAARDFLISSEVAAGLPAIGAPRHTAVVTERSEYVVAVDGTNRASIDAACAAVFELVLPRAVAGTVDAYIGWPDPPAEVVAVERRLAGEYGDDGLMGLPFDLREAREQHDFCTLAPWSIQAEVADDQGTVIASIHDGGTGVEARLTEEEARLLGERLRTRGHDEVEVVAGEEWDRRRRLRKHYARRQALRRLIPRRPM